MRKGLNTIQELFLEQADKEEGEVNYFNLTAVP